MPPVGHPLMLAYALGYFLVISAGLVAVCTFTLRSLRDITRSRLPAQDTLLVRFMVLLNVCGLMRAVILGSLVVVSLAVLVHIVHAHHVAGHYPVIFLVAFLWVGGVLTNSLLKDIYFEAKQGIPPPNN